MPKQKTPDVAQAFITKRRRAYPSLYWTDSDVVLWLLGSSAYDVAWDEEGNIKEIRGVAEEDLKESFTDEGWDYMELALESRMKASWTEPHESSPIIHIPDNISDAWEDKISSLCYRVERINDADMLAWITLHQKFGGSMESYQRDNVNRSYKAFLAVKAALALIKQRLLDIRLAKHATKMAKQMPYQVVAGVTVHHKGFASTETAVVVSVASMPLSAGESMGVAILDRPIRGSLILPTADLKPLTHPPAK